MHGGTQTIRFWGLQHVHWCEGSCCWFLRLQSRLAWEVAIQAVDWFVPEHHLCIGLRCRFCEVHRRHLMHGGTQTIRFWGLQHVHWCEGSCCWFLRLQSRLVWEVAIQAVDWFVPEHHLCIGLRCRFCEVHRRHLMHGGTQTIRFWGLQHVHWCEGSCCWFLRLQSRLVWEVAIQAVDWFVPEHHLCIGLRCRFLRGSPSAFDAWWHANNPLLGATTCPLVWRLMLLVLAAAKQVGLRGGYPGRWLVCSRASSMYWFKVSFLRGSPSAFDAWWHANNPLLGATTCPLVWRLMLLVLAAAKQVGLRGGYPGRWLVCSRASSIYVLV